MATAMAEHDTVLRTVIASNDGWLVKHTGDGVVAAFASARNAVKAAIEAQRALELPVRMGIATGEAEARDGDYFGPALNRAARVMAAGHGGQILLAASTATLVEGVDLLDLGSYQLRDLSATQRLSQVRAAGLREIFPPLRTLDVSPGNLPAQTTRLLGREDALIGLADALGESRLVTLTGVGGVGKTRLALQTAADLQPAYAGGAWLVELATLGDAAAVGHAVASTLGVSQLAGRTIEESLIESLGDQRLLLVLDNCEHLIADVAQLVDAIIARCPNVTILATSREPLAVGGEQSWPVRSLEAAGVTSPAVALFVKRARSAVPEFDLGDDAEAVGEICRRLDGIPLAIELAAARIRTLTPDEIASRLDERFRLLTSGARGSLERHQTLRQAVQWSFDLLSDAERAVQCRASVFAGDFGLPAAEAVCAGGQVQAGDVLDLLDSLVRKSLVTSERTADGMRYRLLETIRRFGEELLDMDEDIEAVRGRHASYAADECDAIFDVWLSPRQREAYEWLDHEMDNVRVAFRWAADGGDTDAAIRIAAGVGDLARMRERYEPGEWASEIVDAARARRHRRLPMILTWAASNAGMLGRLADAKRYGEEAVSLRDDPDFDSFVWAFADLALAAEFEGDLERAVELIRMGATHDADRRDRLCLAFSIHFAAVAGHHEEALRLADEVPPIVETAGVPVAMATAYFGRGGALADSDPAAALIAFERSSEIARASGNRLTESIIGPLVAAVQARAGRPDAALRAIEQTFEGRRGIIDHLFAAMAFVSVVTLFERIGRAEAAAIMFGALHTAIASPDMLEEVVDRVRDVLGDASFSELEQRGRSLTLPDAADYAQDQIRLALRDLGEADR